MNNNLFSNGQYGRNGSSAPQTNVQKPRTVLLSIVATLFSILYARGFTVGQINVLGNLFQAIGEQMTTVSAIQRAPFDEGEEDRLLTFYSRGQYIFLDQKLEEIRNRINEVL